MPPAAPVLDEFDSTSKNVPVEDGNNTNRLTQDLVIGFEPNYRNETNKTEKDAKKKSLDDPWALQEMESFGKPWNELNNNEKIKRIIIGILKGISVLVLLYFFVCSLDLLSLAFRLVGGRTTGDIFRESEFLKNPIVGVMIGILTTVLVQSSSTSTSIIVSMVASDFLDVKQAIPIVMGANIGTSITNTIVSLTQAGDRNQFRRAFAGATVHDMFNWLSVITLLIIEVTTDYLFHLTTAIMDGLAPQRTTGGDVELLGRITKPFVNLIAQLDSKVLQCWAQINCTSADDSSLLKEFCGERPVQRSGIYDTITELDDTTVPPVMEKIKCNFLFATFGLSDGASGGILLACSLIALCTCLILIVKILQSVLRGQIAFVIKKTLNAKIPYVPWITGYIALLVGAAMTFLVQSSSVFTSALTPLVGLGVISVERVYPLTLGSNIGTTTTALLAALATDGGSFKQSMQIALCHLFFNVTGILIFYPIPFMRFPVPMAKFLGNTTAKYRWFAIVYMILMFVVLPLITMGLSFAGSVYVIVFAAIIFVLFLFVAIVNLIREKRPEWLPDALKSWKWLPVPMRSLAPYDKIFTSWTCCKKLRKNSTEDDDDDAEGLDNAGFDTEDNAHETKGNLNMVSIDGTSNGKRRIQIDGNRDNGISNSAFVE